MTVTVIPSTGVEMKPTLKQAQENFERNIAKFEAELKAAGIPFRETCGFRSISEQNKTYAKGRNKPGKIVTYARGGESPHNYDLAKDYALFCDNKKNACDWNTSDIKWSEFGKLAKECGLVWGGSFKKIKDYPHVEHPTWRNYKKFNCSEFPNS